MRINLRYREGGEVGVDLYLPYHRHDDDERRYRRRHYRHEAPVD